MLESLRFLIRVFFGFDFFRYSLLFFGFQYGRSCATAPAKRVRSAGRAPTPGGRRVRPRSASGRLHFHFACESRTTRRLALMLDSLVRVSRRVGRVADVTTDPERDDGTQGEAAARPPHALCAVRTEDEPAERPRPPRGARHRSSIHRRAAPPARCNTLAGARATFARGIRPTTNRSWPAPVASALEPCACRPGRGA